MSDSTTTTIIEAGDNSTNVVQRDEEIKNVLKSCCSGDFYVVGNIWIKALRAGLVGHKDSFIPVVHAASPAENAPKKPPPMKYTELPIYESPHYDYKDYLADKDKCPKYKVKIAHQYLYPAVRRWRKDLSESYHGMKKELTAMKNEVCEEIRKKNKEFIKYMRDPENLSVRQGVVALGTLTGYYIGSGRGIPRRLFFATLGALASGALCFPKETDEIFRDVSFKIGKVLIRAYNLTCRQNFTLRDRLPCPDELPVDPEPMKKKNKCPEKK